MKGYLIVSYYGQLADIVAHVCYQCREYHAFYVVIFIYCTGIMLHL